MAEKDDRETAPEIEGLGDDEIEIEFVDVDASDRAQERPAPAAEEAAGGV